MRGIFRRLIIIIVCIIVVLNTMNATVYSIVNDKNRNFKRITIEDGLSQSSVYSIIQDSKGYMWIGTSDGVNKYNGTKFEVYKYSDNKENSISGNRVSDIKEDLEG
ncbi:two-component regulator propeller domain-containing protein, partial [Clostridium sp.]|uniref:two-component regulator propeller domain-containing protein n=1 Tax=Clostridium sp. TaxID=1506 RepID=UPI003F374FBC